MMKISKKIFELENGIKYVNFHFLLSRVFKYGSDIGSLN